MGSFTFFITNMAFEAFKQWPFVRGFDEVMEPLDHQMTDFVWKSSAPTQRSCMHGTVPQRK